MKKKSTRCQLGKCVRISGSESVSGRASDGYRDNAIDSLEVIRYQKCTVMTRW